MIFQHRISSDLLKPNFSELYRYAGISVNSNLDDALNNLANQATEEIHKVMNCRAVYIKLPLQISDITKENIEKQADNFQKKLIQFGEKQLESRHLAVNLKDSKEVYLFAATLGPEVDKLIQRTSKLNPAKSVFMQAAGAMFIEEYCDILQDFLRQEEEKSGNELCVRYSPGFGDVSLEVQKIFFDLLQCQKNLALTLNDSLIMSPEKSVTAFIGVKRA